MSNGRGLVLLAIAIAVLGALGAACHGSGTHGDGGPTGSPDVASTGHHFDNCTTVMDCPAGDTCSVPEVNPPVADPGAPMQCRPPCTSDVACISTVAVASLSASCNVNDHHCTALCGCNPGYTCHTGPPGAASYCAR